MITMLSKSITKPAKSMTTMKTSDDKLSLLSFRFATYFHKHHLQSETREPPSKLFLHYLIRISVAIIFLNFQFLLAAAGIFFYIPFAVA